MSTTVALAVQSPLVAPDIKSRKECPTFSPNPNVDFASMTDDALLAFWQDAAPVLKGAYDTVCAFLFEIFTRFHAAKKRGEKFWGYSNFDKLCDEKLDWTSRQVRRIASETSKPEVLPAIEPDADDSDVEAALQALAESDKENPSFADALQRTFDNPIEERAPKPVQEKEKGESRFKKQQREWAEDSDAIARAGVQRVSLTQTCVASGVPCATMRTDCHLLGLSDKTLNRVRKFLTSEIA